MERLLEGINNPDELRLLKPEQLPQLAEELREEIITTVSKTGGHLASSLGVVELTVALHYVFNTPQDKIVWDVGHQSYAHKILTGRRKRFHTLRQHKGISGFPRREESIYDAFNVGHSSTSISAALGIAEARCLKGETHKVIAVIGDGSLMAGLAWEGLNQAGHIKKDFIVILNDNEMSISPNVGALSAYLSRIITGQFYNRFKTEMVNFVNTIPSIGKSMLKVAKQSEEFLKGLLVPGLLFEELGFRYIGPISGHRFDHLLENLQNVKNLHGPILIHVLTNKGKGYAPAEENPIAFHGTGPFDVKTGRPSSKKTSAPSYTQVFAQTLIKLAKNNNNIIAITAGMPDGTGLDKFSEAFPDKFYDVGIAEQHAITFAAGMAVEGLRPVIAIYSTFLQRGYDQILHDVCYQNLPVVFVLDRAGIVGEDGATHNGLFDLSYLRSIPNMIIMAPKDENELQHMLKTALSCECPVAVRYPRGKGYGVALDKQLKDLPIGKAEFLQDGDDLVILAVGGSVYPSLNAAERLKEAKIKTGIVNVRFVKPLDKELICTLARKVGRIITVEENVLSGGFGSSVLETLGESDIQGVKVKCLGINDMFVEHGSQSILRKKYGLDVEGIVRSAREILDENDKRSKK
ncbi:MAG: 1-deoxy-D-xylulose-5-phosphate synthase [Deltaproteobacteria bacterium]|nr:1-deoxy-D-xylulose-5-phosphate synthase [Deltaproteobacteria bacterium]